MKIKILNGIAVIKSDNVIISDIQSALDLIATVSYEHQCERIVINKEAFAEEFFRLSSGLAGEILQKFVTYKKKIAIYGDFSHYTSKPLHDFIYECNNSRHIYFVNNEDEAVKRLL